MFSGNPFLAESSSKQGRHVGRRNFLCVVVALSIILTCTQIGIALSNSVGASFQARYLALERWDAFGYNRIAEMGYVRSNGNYWTDVAWFPGHPLMIRVVHLIPGISWHVATLVASQIACVMFWIFFLLFLHRFRLPWLLQGLAVTAVLFYPTSFFLINGYAEPLFIGSILGMLYWLDDDRTHAVFLALLFAVIASFTRFTVLAFVPIPLVFGVCTRRWKRGLIVSLALLSGPLLYFTYLYWAFGDFFHFFHAQKFGWNVTPLRLQDMTPSFLWFQRPLKQLVPQIISGNGFALSDFLFVVVTNGVLLLLALDLCISWLYRDRSVLYRQMFFAGAATSLYVGFSGTFTVGMPSMSRYTLPVIILGTLGLMHFLSVHRHHPRFSQLLEFVIPTLAIFCLPLHWKYVHYFIMQQGWVY